MVFSGVFTPEGGVWTVPVLIAPGGVVTMDNPTAPDTLRQGFQIYHSAKVGLFHRATREMHVMMFGGITVLEHNTTTGQFTADEQAPFTNQCGVVGATAGWRIPTILSAHAVSADSDVNRQGTALRRKRRVLSRCRNADAERGSNRPDPTRGGRR